MPHKLNGHNMAGAFNKTARRSSADEDDLAYIATIKLSVPKFTETTVVQSSNRCSPKLAPQGFHICRVQGPHRQQQTPQGLLCQVHIALCQEPLICFRQPAPRQFQNTLPQERHGTHRLGNLLWRTFQNGKMTGVRGKFHQLLQVGSDPMNTGCHLADIVERDLQRFLPFISSQRASGDAALTWSRGHESKC